MKNKKSLAETHPEVASQWHHKKNGKLTPFDVTPASGKKVWWKCLKYSNHTFQNLIANQYKYSLKYSKPYCKICDGRKIIRENSTGVKFPHLIKEWHPTKNGVSSDLLFKIGPGSHGKYWWKCTNNKNHEWEARLYSRSNGHGCPFCSGNKSETKNSAAVEHPILLEEWHPVKNGNITKDILYKYSSRSSKVFWWKCNKGDDHEWKTRIQHRTNGSGCPFCSGNKVSKTNNLAYLKPDVAAEWHPTKNGDLTPDQVTVKSTKVIWWQCAKNNNHVWKVSLANRRGCPFCSNHKVSEKNSFYINYPEIAKEWHPKKNKDIDIHNLSFASNKIVWWQCSVDNLHEWCSSVNNRTTKKSGCPICSGRIAVKETSLGYLNPELSSQWHPSKNNNLTVFDVRPGSGKKVWWKCPKGDDHIWQATISSRTAGNGCPICTSQIIIESNSLAVLSPKIASQWHPTKNGNLTPYDVGRGSTAKVWWKCDKGIDHEWKASVSSRNKSNCPFCTLTPQSKQELTITFELIKLFKNIDPKGLKTRLNGRLRTVDIYIPKLNLCIEFDGNYWHKGKREIDKIKSEMLLDKGFKLIRVREEPLKKIYDTDVISKKPYNGKQVTNNILSKILNLFDLDVKLVTKIKAYQSKSSLQNEKGLEKYIDKILSEKVSKS